MQSISELTSVYSIPPIYFLDFNLEEDHSKLHNTISTMTSLPTRTLGGVTVPDTPLITKALAYARHHNNDVTYNHVVRSWLYSQVIADQNPAFKSRDQELQAVSVILHDLGWSSAQELISKDKRFEVDGANAARLFLLSEGGKSEWDKHRLQLAWDVIALHTTPSIAAHKEVEVQIGSFGIFADFLGAEKVGISKKVWDGISKEFPRTGLREGVKEALCGLCREKPATTYDNFVGQFGERFVVGYKEEREGKQPVDAIMATVE